MGQISMKISALPGSVLSENQHPDEVSVPGQTPQQALETLTWEAAARTYPEGVPDEVRKSLNHELGLIGRMEYAPYFLTVNSIVRYARSQDILCQGRGSPANSAVCYVLGITAIDPARSIQNSYIFACG